MATLESFKYYSELFTQYISTRFGILKFFGFALLIVMLGADKLSEWAHYAEDLVFVFFSLFVFRMIDDGWSFRQDRVNHPDRIYIHPEHIRSFILLTAVIFVFYQTALFMFSLFLGFAILVLFLVSTFLYLLCVKSGFAMFIIPLLKYPVFIWCISRFSMSAEVLFLSSGAFSMMATFDFIHENPARKSRLFMKTALLLITGLLVLQPWDENSIQAVQIILILTPFILFILPESNLYRFFTILIFPVIHVIDLMI
jgi:hypothetical protein